MSKQKYAVIKGTGKYLPEEVIKNEWFLKHEFFDDQGNRVPGTNEEIIEKFYQITNIAERRYANTEQSTSDLATIAARRAIEDAGIDPETLDYIIVAHNSGDTRDKESTFPEIIPSVATRVKHKLNIANPNTVAYDIIFGCPGWLQGIIQANYYIKSGDAQRVMVIGAETLSRFNDPHDRDSMIYADGAGATILEAIESDSPVGIITHNSQTYAGDEAFYLWMGDSFKKDAKYDKLFLKMYGRRLYNFALKNVPLNVKTSLDKAHLHIDDIKKILIHQANEKMDEAIIRRLFKLYGQNEVDLSIMPMVIKWLGNSSVATIPTLLDMMFKGEIPNQKFYKGNHMVFASVGAGANINSLVYRCTDDFIHR